MSMKYLKQFMKFDVHYMITLTRCNKSYLDRLVLNSKPYKEISTICAIYEEKIAIRKSTAHLLSSFFFNNEKGGLTTKVNVIIISNLFCCSKKIQYFLLDITLKTDNELSSYLTSISRITLFGLAFYC